MNHKPLDWVQALRGIAALLVVLCHGRTYLSSTPGFQSVQDLFLPGAMGVDLFFIISGFIMVYSTRSADSTLIYSAKFVIKRFSRIWPVYFVATLLWLIVTNRLTSYISTSSLTIEFFKSIFFIPINTTRGLFFEPTLQLGWTLDFEMYFYLAFSIALLFGRLRTLAICAWALLTVVIAPALTRSFSIDPLQTYAYSFSYLNLATSPIILEFIAGCIIAEIYLHPKIQIKNQIVAINLAASAGAIMIWRNYSETGVFHGLGHWGWPLALMVLFIGLYAKTFTIPTPRIMVWIGEISFSLYLTHLSTRVIVDRLAVHFGHTNLMNTWTYIGLTTVISIALAALSHHYLEQGLSEFIRRKLIALSFRSKHPKPQTGQIEQKDTINAETQKQLKSLS